MAIRVRDNREPLVDIRRYCPGIKIDLDSRRMSREKTAYLRLTAAKMLRKAQRSLPKAINFVVGDAWRPAIVQTYIYLGLIRTFSKRSPRWSRHRVIKEVKEYVAPWRGERASGHMTGGAIDLRLIDERGHKVPMKSGKLTYQENALSIQPRLPAYIRRNRKILFTAMTKAGFSNYPKEYWHWSYGDYYWAKRNHKRTAIYGAVPDYRELYTEEACPCGSGKKYKKCCGK